MSAFPTNTVSDGATPASAINPRSNPGAGFRQPHRSSGTWGQIAIPRCCPPIGGFVDERLHQRPAGLLRQQAVPDVVLVRREPEERPCPAPRHRRQAFPDPGEEHPLAGLVGARLARDDTPPEGVVNVEHEQPDHNFPAARRAAAVTRTSSASHRCRSAPLTASRARVVYPSLQAAYATS